MQLAILVALLSTGFGATFWRLNRLETRLGDFVTREEFLQLRQEIAAMRSDLTQVALAVGARPRLTQTPPSK